MYNEYVRKGIADIGQRLRRKQRVELLEAETCPYVAIDTTKLAVSNLWDI